MTFVHYDVETAGLFLPGEPSENPNHPQLLSITAIQEDLDGNIVKAMSCLIKPEGWTIDERLEIPDPSKPGKMMKSAFAVNGITNAMAEKYGVPLKDALLSFYDIARPKTVLVAFNFSFDWKFLKISIARAALKDPDLFGTMREAYERDNTTICTMRAAAHHLIGKQRISLKNAHFELFKREFEGAHGSFADAMASRAVYRELRRRGYVFEPRSLVYDATPTTPTASA